SSTLFPYTTLFRSRVINNLLEFRGGSAAVPLYEIGLPACVDRIQKPESAQFIGGHDSQQVDRFIRVMKVQRNVGTDHREPVFLYASVKRKLPVQFVGQLLCSRDITCQREGLRRPHWDSTFRGQPQCLPCIRPG